MKSNNMIVIPKNVRVNPDLVKELGTFTENSVYVNELEKDSLDAMRYLMKEFLSLIGKTENRNFARDFGLQPK